MIATMETFGLVTQEDEWGCGVACVASLLGTSYRDAKELLRGEKGKSVNAGVPGLELHHIALALQRRRVQVVADWEELSNFPLGTIVCIGGKGAYAGDHYMLMTPNGWMDPWVNIGERPRRAGYRDTYPDGAHFLVALVAKSG